MSNYQIKSKLQFTDDKYEKLKEQLLQERYIEKYQCRGGGLKITKAGEKLFVDEIRASSVTKEKELYEPFINVLNEEIKENEENAIVMDTSSLRKKGKWTHPDIIKIAHRHYPIQRLESTVLITYEIKQLDRWDNSCVYETASHAAFSHQLFVVLEWAKDDEDYSSLENILYSCRRFNVALITIVPYNEGYRYMIHSKSETRNPSPELVEEYLEYVFDRIPKYKDDYDNLFITKT